MGILAVRPLANILLRAGVMDLSLEILDLVQWMQTACRWMGFLMVLCFFIIDLQRIALCNDIIREKAFVTWISLCNMEYEDNSCSVFYQIHHFR